MQGWQRVVDSSVSRVYAMNVDWVCEGPISGTLGERLQSRPGKERQCFVGESFSDVLCFCKSYSGRWARLCACSFPNDMTEWCVVVTGFNKMCLKVTWCAWVSFACVHCRFPSLTGEARICAQGTWICELDPPWWRTTLPKAKGNTGSRGFPFENSKRVCSCPGSKTTREAHSSSLNVGPPGSLSHRSVCLGMWLPS